VAQAASADATIPIIHWGMRFVICTPESSSTIARHPLARS
jgi:hypothetical protein